MNYVTKQDASSPRAYLKESLRHFMEFLLNLRENLIEFLKHRVCAEFHSNGIKYSKITNQLRI